MNLRQKVVFLVTLILAGLIAVLSVSLSRILLKSFSELETKNTYENVQRVQAAINEELNKLSLTAGDWAGWDDTYFFVKNPQQVYIDKNLADSTFENIEVNLLLFFNQKNKQILGLDYDLEASEFSDLDAEITRKIVANNLLLSHQTLESNIQGFLLLEQGLLMLVSKPVLTSERTGPIVGTMIMGRWINQTRIEQLQERTRLSLKLHQIDQLPDDLMLIVKRLKNQDDDIFVKTRDANNINGYSLIYDLNKNPIILLEINLFREIYRQGKIALFSLISSLVLVGFIFEFVTIVLLDKLILYRLTRLNYEIEKIGHTNDLSLRVHVVDQKDELTNFANTINYMLDELQKEREKTEKLLLNVLPKSIAQQLKKEHQIIAENFEEVTILFADIVGFTSWSSRLNPLEVVKFLNHIFSDFDHLADRLGLEKIKTIGDAYMVAAGLPMPRPDHAEAIAEMALAMRLMMRDFSQKHQQDLQMRIGINTGVVVAGVIGTKKFVYDLWGDAVNIASRMESLGEAGKIQVTESTYQILKNEYFFEKRGIIEVKGKGKMTTYWLNNRRY
jgi:sensor domain CHASE-containing protein/class 3 adenylate cyclase